MEVPQVCNFSKISRISRIQNFKKLEAILG
jgi:hypothetical protein